MRISHLSLEENSWYHTFFLRYSVTRYFIILWHKYLFLFSPSYEFNRQSSARSRSRVVSIYPSIIFLFALRFSSSFSSWNWTLAALYLKYAASRGSVFDLSDDLPLRRLHVSFELFRQGSGSAVNDTDADGWDADGSVLSPLGVLTLGNSVTASVGAFK